MNNKLGKPPSKPSVSLSMLPVAQHSIEPLNDVVMVHFRGRLDTDNFNKYLKDAFSQINESLPRLSINISDVDELAIPDFALALEPHLKAMKAKCSQLILIHDKSKFAVATMAFSRLTRQLEIKCQAYGHLSNEARLYIHRSDPSKLFSTDQTGRHGGKDKEEELVRPFKDFAIQVSLKGELTLKLLNTIFDKINELIAHNRFHIVISSLATESVEPGVSRVLCNHFDKLKRQSCRLVIWVNDSPKHSMIVTSVAARCTNLNLPFKLVTSYKAAISCLEIEANKSPSRR